MNGAPKKRGFLARIIYRFNIENGELLGGFRNSPKAQSTTTAATSVSEDANEPKGTETTEEPNQ